MTLPYLSHNEIASILRMLIVSELDLDSHYDLHLLDQWAYVIYTLSSYLEGRSINSIEEYIYRIRKDLKEVLHNKKEIEDIIQ